MKNEIQLLKNNDHIVQADVEWISGFYEYLQEKERLNKTKAFRIIYYLQEHLPILPDHIEKCDRCGDLYDSDSEGYHSEKRGKFYCGNCTTFNDED